MKSRTLLMILACISTLLPALRAGELEMRGLWASAWHPGFRNSEQVAGMVARARQCSFNALFVQVRRRGDVYYRSAIEPMASGVAPDYDPLADVITQAHAAGLQVHAWISVFDIYHDVKENTPPEGSAYVEHPGWLMKDSRGNTRFPGNKVFLDPGVPEVQGYLLSIAQEIVKNYKVDGLHLDMARYPNLGGGYNETSVARFNDQAKKTGKPYPDDRDWCDWRRSQITSLVRAVYRKAKAMRPAVRVSAAVQASRGEAYRDSLQDWEGWLKAGILDFAVPMVFAKDNQQFEALVKQALACGGDRPIYIGQGGWQLKSAQSMEQTKMALAAGAKGMVLYNYARCREPLRGDSVSLMEKLKQEVYAKPTVNSTPAR